MKESELVFDKRTSEIMDNVNAFVKTKISPSLFVSDEYKLENNVFLYNINNCFPKRAWDNSEDIAIYRFISIYSIGTLKAEDLGKKIKVDIPDIAELQRKFNTEIQNIYRKSEIALLKTIHDNLVQIPLIQTAMTPIRVILEKVEEKGEVLPTESFGYHNPKKVNKYVEFLVGLDFLKVEDNKIVPGCELNAIRSMDIPPKVFHKKVLSSVLNKGFAYIQEYLHLTLITPFIRLSNAYFFPSYQSNKLLEFGVKDFVDSHYDIYKIKKSRDKIASQLSYIVEQEILYESRKGFYIGQPEIYESFSHFAPPI